MTNKSEHVRLAIVVSHPIQHFTPFYRAIARTDGIVLRVFFCSRLGAEKYFDKEMGVEIAWEMDLLGGYDHIFLPEAETIRETGFTKINNPSIPQYLSAFRPHVVLHYGYSQLTQMRSILWCKRNKIAAMMIGDSELLRHRAFWKRTVKMATLPILYRNIDSILTVGDKNEAYYRHYLVNKTKMFRSPFTIDEDTFREVREQRTGRRRQFREEHDIPEENFLVLFVGKLTETKRPHDLIRAAAIIAHQGQRDRRVRFAVAGNGNLLNELTNAVKDQNLPVHFLGFVNVDKLTDVYCAADALIHPAEKDAHPLITSEAACVGLPLIVSDRVGSVGPTDIARPGENTIVYPCGDVNALAAAIMQLASHYNLQRSMSEASLRIYSELDVNESLQGLKDAICCALKSKGDYRICADGAR